MKEHLERKGTHRHKWDLISDTCLKCGLQRRIVHLYRKGTLISCGKTREYLVNGEWIYELPMCK